MITVVFTILCAWYDAGKRFENHDSRFIFRAVIISLISIYECPLILLGLWKHTVAYTLFNASLFYLLFDYALNIFERRPWNYVGTTSDIDKLWLKFGGWFPQLIFKVLFVLMIFIIKKNITLL